MLIKKSTHVHDSISILYEKAKKKPFKSDTVQNINNVNERKLI